MLRKIIKNKILSCLLFVAAICQPAKAEVMQVGQSKEGYTDYTKAQGVSEVVSAEETYMGRYDLKNGDQSLLKTVGKAAKNKPVQIMTPNSQTDRELKELLSETEKPVVASKKTVETKPLTVASTSRSSNTQVNTSADSKVSAMQKEEQKKANVAMAKNLEKNIAGFLGSFMVLGILGYAVGNMSDKKNDIESVLHSQVMSADEGFVKAKEPQIAKKETVREEQPAEKSEKPIVSQSAFKPEVQHDERKIIAEHIWGLKAIDEVKCRRAVLRLEMAKAKRADDKDKIAKIREEREKLSAKRKAACMRIMGPDMARIRNERRALTRRMTVARRQKDQLVRKQMMTEVTTGRLILKQQVQSMNSYIRAVDYQRYRKDFMQELHARQKEYARAA